jgi:hypothetical protein
MPKVVLEPVSSGYMSLEAMNRNWEAIEEALENTLSRDGTSPNGMDAPLDMDSNRIINLPEPLSATEPARLGDLEAFVDRETHPILQLEVSDPGASSDISVANGKRSVAIPARLDGATITAFEGSLITAGSSGVFTCRLVNSTTGQTITSTNLTIDQGETSSLSASTSVVLNPAYTEVSGGDVLRIDVVGSSTGARGLICTIVF